MRLAPFERGRLVKENKRSVDARADEALLPQRGKRLLVRPLLPLHDWRQKEDLQLA